MQHHHHCHCTPARHSDTDMPPPAMFFHPALLPGSSSLFISGSSDSNDDGAARTTRPLELRIEVPPSTTSDGAAPLLEPTASPGAGSSPAAVAFVLLFWAVVIAGLVFYWRFF